MAKRTSSLLRDQPPKDLHTEPQLLPSEVLWPLEFGLFFLVFSSASDPQPQKGQGRRSGKRVLTWQPTSNQPHLIAFCNVLMPLPAAGIVAVGATPRSCLLPPARCIYSAHPALCI